MPTTCFHSPFVQHDILLHTVRHCSTKTLTNSNFHRLNIYEGDGEMIEKATRISIFTIEKVIFMQLLLAVSFWKQIHTFRISVSFIKLIWQWMGKRFKILTKNLIKFEIFKINNLLQLFNYGKFDHFLKGKAQGRSKIKKRLTENITAIIGLPEAQISWKFTRMLI